MKKLLLFLSSAMALSGFAAVSEPQLWFGEAMSGISPDGNWIAGQIADGSVIIRNLSTDQYWVYYSDGGNRNYYVGHGVPVSDIGVIAGATTTSNAAYWENGQWTVLPTPNPGTVSNAVSITPDGGIICGGVGQAPMGGDTETTMMHPALWYRQENGKYSDPVVLPHPNLDLTGRAPQYITAIAISDDGKTVAGQIMDYFGGCCEPLIYQCDENGEWSYTLLGRDLLNPTNIEFPEWPGGLDDDILMPTQEWYMTPEQIEAFVEAFNAWDNTGEPPHYEDFMTPEVIEEYQKDMKEYLEIYLPWQEKFNTFMDIYRQYLARAASFGFNNGRLSPDGKYYVTTAGGVRPQGSSRNGTFPVIFDTETGEYTILNSNRTVSVNYVAADYTILANMGGGGDTGTIKAYVFPQMQPGGMLLEDWIEEINPDLFDWMEQKLYQDVIVGIDSNDVYVTELMFCTGIPTGTPDLKYILTNNYTSSWLDDPGQDFVSVLLPTGLGASVGGDDEEDKNAVNEIFVGEEVVSYEVFDLTGRLVLSARSLGDLDALKGIYIVKASTSEGKALTSKVVL